jgi:hypothetical protein
MLLPKIIYKINQNIICKSKNNFILTLIHKILIYQKIIKSTLHVRPPFYLSFLNKFI